MSSFQRGTYINTSIIITNNERLIFKENCMLSYIAYLTHSPHKPIMYKYSI